MTFHSSPINSVLCADGDACKHATLIVNGKHTTQLSSSWVQVVLKLYMKDSSTIMQPFTEMQFLEAASAAECKCFPEHLAMGLDWSTGLPILVMVHAGEPSSTYLHHHPEMLLTVVFGTAVAIDQCHRLGYCHCNVKPENVLVDTSAGRPQTTLIGFGSARTISSFSPSSRPKYAAPEVLGVVHAKHAAKLDPWGLGCLIYQLLTGSAFLPDHPVEHNKLVMQPKVEELQRISSLPSKSKHPGNATSGSALQALLEADKQLQDSLKQVLVDPHSCHLLDLLVHLLHPSPDLRSPVSYAIRHPVFTGLRKELITRELKDVTTLSLHTEEPTPMESLLKELTAKGFCVCGKAYEGSCPACTTGLTPLVAKLGVKSG